MLASARAAFSVSSLCMPLLFLRRASVRRSSRFAAMKAIGSGVGLPSKKPWTSFPPNFTIKSSCSRVSTPSAITFIPKLCASMTSE